MNDEEGGIAVLAETECFARGLCEVCAACDAKYTCPRCEVKSCCLACVKQHKRQRDCSGQRDITAFKAVADFTNLDLLSDYRFLEETARSVERARRDPHKFASQLRRLPVRLMKLRQAAAERGTRLLFLPDCFSRHLQNTTYYDWKANLIKWRIEWHFPQVNSTVYIDELLSEEQRMCSLLAKYLEPDVSGSLMSECLEPYQAAGLLGVRLLLKAESVEKAGARFHLINTSHKLKAALKGKTVVEFPIIYVILQEHSHLYDLVLPGERRKVLQRIEIANQKRKLRLKMPPRRRFQSGRLRRGRLQRGRSQNRRPEHSKPQHGKPQDGKPQRGKPQGGHQSGRTRKHQRKTQKKNKVDGMCNLISSSTDGPEGCKRSEGSIALDRGGDAEASASKPLNIPDYYDLICEEQ